MDPVILQIVLGIGSLVGGYFLRHLTAPAPAPSAPSKHPVLDALGPAVLAAIEAALAKKAQAQGHGELVDLISHLSPAPRRPDA